ncbi:MAG TPA: cytochrome b N-terminal domain-containing protein [Nitrospiria bacterium]|nr:cytochrome b N-terminal domain-containing protein [Nitrospiria bacterium]
MAQRAARPPSSRPSDRPNGIIERYLKLSRLSYPVPAHGKTLPYTLGGIVFLGFLLLFASGFLLAQFVDPSPERAYQSVKALGERVPGGSWVRALHYWTAQAAVVALILHVLRIVFSGAYKAPRLVTWYVGLALLGLGVFGSYFSGTVLKWDQESFDALKHYEAGLTRLGPLGAFLGSTDAVSLNVKLYASHVSILPLVIVAFLAAHFYLVNTHSLSPLPFGEDSARESVPKERMTGTMTEHVKGIVLFGGIYFGVTALLAAIVPAPLGDPVTGEEMSLKPPWPFLWLYGLENLTGKMDTMFHALGALFLALAVLPLVDRGPERNPARRKGVLAVAGIALISMIGLTAYAAIAPPQMHHHEHGSGHDAPAMSHDAGTHDTMPDTTVPHDASPHDRGTPDAAVPDPSPADNHHDETPREHAP